MISTNSGRERHLYAAGWIEVTQETNGKLAYSVTVWTDGTAQCVKPPHVDRA